jgi:hypothetical protein
MWQLHLLDTPYVQAVAAGAYRALRGSGRGGWLTEFEEQSIVWRKSTASGHSNCVEVAVHDGSVFVRDSINPTGAVLLLPPGAWSTFLVHVRRADSATRQA